MHSCHICIHWHSFSAYFPHNAHQTWGLNYGWWWNIIHMALSWTFFLPTHSAYSRFYPVHIQCCFNLSTVCMYVFKGSELCVLNCKWPPLSTRGYTDRYIYTPKHFVTSQDTYELLIIVMFTHTCYRCSDKARNSPQRSEEQKHFSKKQQYMLHFRLWLGGPSHRVNRYSIIHIYTKQAQLFNEWCIILIPILRSCRYLQYQSTARN